MAWIMTWHGVSWVVHYLNNFLTLGPGGSQECGSNMSNMIDVCIKAGLPIEPSKTVGPAAAICFLGMELDLNEGTIRFPADKLRDLKAQLRIWRRRRACRKRELMLLLGILNHPSKAVRAGRAFYIG